MTTKRFLMTMKSWSGKLLKGVCYDEEIVFLKSVFIFFDKYLARNFCTHDVQYQCLMFDNVPISETLFFDAIPDRLFSALGIRFNACTSDDVQ